MNTVEISPKDYSKKQDQLFRDVFVGGTNQKVVIFPKGKEILAEGVLPGDDEIYSLGSEGQHGIIRIENDVDLTIEGNGANIYADDWLVDNLDTDNDGVADDDRDNDGVLDQPGYRDRIQRSFIKTINDTGTTINNLNYTNNNDRPRHKTGKPEFDTQREFDHYLRVLNSKDLTVKGGVAKYIWGDGVYISGNDSENIKILDLRIDWNGRQGAAIAGGRRILFDGIEITNTRRGGFDFESPLPYHITDGVVVQNSFVKAGLLAFPMAGSGRCDNILIQNNLHHGSGVTLCRATNGATKKNIIFSGNTNVGQGGTYNFIGVNNILIEDEVQTRKPSKEQLGVLVDCKNIWIRNNNFDHTNPGTDLYFELAGTTTPEDVHIYGNDNIKLKYKGEIIEPVNTESVDGIPFEVDPFITQYYKTANKVVEYVEASPTKVRDVVQVNKEIPGNVLEEALQSEDSLEELLLNLIQEKEGDVFDWTGYFYLYKEVGKYDPTKTYKFEYIARDKVYEFEITVNQEQSPENTTTMILEKPENFKVQWDSGSNLRMKWEPVANATEYVFKRRRPGGKFHETITSEPYINIIGGGSKNPGIWEMELYAKNIEGISDTVYLTVDTNPEPTTEEPVTEEPATEEPTPVTKEEALASLNKITEYLNSL